MAKAKLSIPFLKRIAAATTRSGGVQVADFAQLVRIIEDKADRWGNYIRDDGTLNPDPFDEGMPRTEIDWEEVAGVNFFKDYDDLVLITEMLGDDVKFIRKDTGWEAGWASGLVTHFDPLLPGHQVRWELDTSSLSEEFQEGSGRQNFAFQEFREDLFAQYADTRAILESVYSTGYSFEELGKGAVSSDLYDELLIGGVEADVEAIIQNYMAENGVFYAEEMLEGDEENQHLQQILLMTKQLYEFYEAKARREIGILSGENLEAFRDELQEEYEAGDIDNEALLSIFEEDKGTLSLDSARDINDIQHANAAVKIADINLQSQDTALGTTLEGIEWDDKWDFAGLTDKDATETEIPTSTWDAILIEPARFLGQGFDFGIEDTQLITWLEGKKEEIEAGWVEANKDPEFDERFDEWFSDNWTGTVRTEIHNQDPTIHIGGHADYTLDPLIKRHVDDIPILNGMRGAVSDLIKKAIMTLRAEGSTNDYRLTKTEAYEELFKGHPGIDTGLIKRAFISDLIHGLEGGSQFVEALNASDIDLYEYIGSAGSLNNPTQWLQGIVDAAVAANPGVLPGVGPNFVQEDVIAFSTLATSLLSNDPDFEGGGLALRNAMRQSLISQFRLEYGSSNIQDMDPELFTKVYDRLGDNFAENQLREIITQSLPRGEAGTESPASRMIASLEQSAENKAISFTQAFFALGIDPDLDRGEVFSAALFEAFENLGPTKEELAEQGLREQFEGFSEQLIQQAMANLQSFISGRYPDEDLSDVLATKEDVQTYISRILQMTENTWAGQNEDDRELLLAIAKSYSDAEDESGVRTFIQKFPELAGMSSNVMAAEIEENLGRYTEAGADTSIIDELMIDRGIIKSIEEANLIREQEQVARDLLKREVEAGYRERIKDIDPSLFAGTLAKIEDMIYQKGLTFTEAMEIEDLVVSIDDKISEIESDFALQEELEEYQEDKARFELENKAANLVAMDLQRRAQELDNEALLRKLQFEETQAATDLRALTEGQELRSEFGSTFDAEFQRQAYGSLSGTGAGMVASDVGAKLRADYTNEALARAGLQAGQDIHLYQTSIDAVAHVGPQGETADYSPESFIAGLGPDYFRQQLRESQLRRRPVRSGVARDITRQTQGPQFTPNRI